MVKHKAWATTIVAPKSVGSMTTKEPMKPTCRVSFTASQAGENSQSNVPDHTIATWMRTYRLSAGAGRARAGLLH